MIRPILVYCRNIICVDAVYIHALVRICFTYSRCFQFQNLFNNHFMFCKTLYKLCINHYYNNSHTSYQEALVLCANCKPTERRTCYLSVNKKPIVYVKGPHLQYSWAISIHLYRAIGIIIILCTESKFY